MKISKKEIKSLRFTNAILFIMFLATSTFGIINLFYSAYFNAFSELFLSLVIGYVYLTCNTSYNRLILTLRANSNDINRENNEIKAKTECKCSHIYWEQQCECEEVKAFTKMNEFFDSLGSGGGTGPR